MNRLLKEYLVVQLVVVVLFVVILIPQMLYEPAASNVTINTSNPPLMTPPTRFAFEYTPFATTYKIVPVADYVISGVVLDKKRYMMHQRAGLLGQMDVGLAWGRISSPESREGMRFNNKGGRVLISKFDSVYQYTLADGYYSNNHLIPANENVSRGFDRLKKESLVRLEGYLVNAYSDRMKWETSTVIGGDGNCEIIYVKRLFIDGYVYE